MPDWKKLLLACSLMFSMTSICGATLQMNDFGDAVKEFQRNLSLAGYYVEADGNFGPATMQAVKQFQRNHHLIVDGVVGSATYRALFGSQMISGQRAETMEQPRLFWHPYLNETSSDRELNSFASQTAAAITSEAQKYIGIPYRFGGSDTSGFDCSGFIQYIFQKKGIMLPRAADQQYHYGEQIAFSALRPGDLVFFSTYEPGVSHSGIYIGDGNFISATSSRGIAIANMTDGYWLEHYIGAKRIL